MKRAALVLAAVACVVIVYAFGRFATHRNSDAPSVAQSKAGPPPQKSSTPRPQAELAAAPSSNQTPQAGSDRSEQLPPTLLAGIETALPGYHLPNSKDGDAKNSRETSSPFSFHCSGDFTSSGHEEFALILLGQDQLRVAIFAPNAGGPYRLIYLARPKIAEEWGEYAEGSLVQHAEQIEMRTIPKGESWAPESGDVFENFHAPRDAIDLHTHPKPNYDFASLLLHENGEFQQLNSQPLIRLQ